MKRSVWFILFLLLFFSLGHLFVGASSLSIPEQVSPYISEEEFSKEDPMTLNKLFSVENIVNLIMDAIAKLFPSAQKIIASILLSVTFISVVQQMKIGSSANFFEKTTGISFNCVVMLCLFPAIQTSCNMISDAVESMDVFVKSSIPVVSTLFLSNGQPFTSSVFSGGIILLCNFMTLISDSILLPLVTLYLSLGVCQTVSSDINVIYITDFIKKAVLWFIGVVFSIFSFSFTMQSFLAKSADTVSRKLVKSAASQLPMIGGAISGGMDGIFSMASSVKNTFLCAGIFVILAVFIGPILYTAVMSFSTYLCEIFCGFMGNSSALPILRLVKESFTILLVVMISCVVICIICYLLVCLNI